MPKVPKGFSHWPEEDRNLFLHGYRWGARAQAAKQMDLIHIMVSHRLHFIYDANVRSQDPDYHNYWCCCGHHFESDKVAAAEHVARMLARMQKETNEEQSS